MMLFDYVEAVGLIVLALGAFGVTAVNIVAYFAFDRRGKSRERK